MDPIDTPCVYCGAEAMEPCAPDCLPYPDPYIEETATDA